MNLVHCHLPLNSGCLTKENINTFSFHFGAYECWVPCVPKLSTHDTAKAGCSGRAAKTSWSENPFEVSKQAVNDN